MTEPEYGTPEWHQHILDSLHDEIGVRVSHDRMEFPGGHTFPVLGPHVTVSPDDNFNTSVRAQVASEHLYPRRFLVDKYTNDNEHQHFLDFFHVHNAFEPQNDVHYETQNSNSLMYPSFSNSPNLLHPEQFGLEVQKRLRTVKDPEISEDVRKGLIEKHKDHVLRHLNRNKKILFTLYKSNQRAKHQTLYNPNTSEVQSVHPDEWGSY
jgi:hypothetical protein